MTEITVCTQMLYPEVGDAVTGHRTVLPSVQEVGGAGVAAKLSLQSC